MPGFDEEWIESVCPFCSSWAARMTYSQQSVGGEIQRELAERAVRAALDEHVTAAHVVLRVPAW